MKAAVTDRARYHGFKSALWLWRAFTLALAVLLLSFSPDELLRSLIGVPAVACCIFIILALIHDHRQATCSPANDCGDEHQMS